MNANEDFSPAAIARPEKLSLQIEAQIRGAIEKKVFISGDNLPSEQKLCKIFKVSRSVVRESLFILSAKGLIDIKKGKCATVLEPTIDNVLDPFSQLVNYRCGNKGLDYILAVRKLLEPEITFLSAQHRSSKDLEEMEKCLELMQAAKKDIIKISHWDIQFHNAIVNSCNNPLMPIVLEPIFHVLAKYHPPIFYDENVVRITTTYHEKIIDLIAAQKKDEAFDAMKMHLEVAGRHNLRLYTAKAS